MMLYYYLLTLFTLVSLAVAVDPQIVFTSTPVAVVADNTYNLTWSGGDGVSPVTIELRRGNSANLTWVVFLSTDATNNFFLWTVSPDLPDASDYALQIFEMANVNNINYSARFSLTGGISSTTATTTIPAEAPGAGTGSSMGTGSPLPKNSTFVVATLTSLTATCSGLNGICVGPSTPSATAPISSAGSLTNLPVATSTQNGQAGRVAACPEHVVMLVAILLLAAY